MPDREVVEVKETQEAENEGQDRGSKGCAIEESRQKASGEEERKRENSVTEREGKRREEWRREVTRREKGRREKKIEK